MAAKLNKVSIPLQWQRTKVGAIAGLPIALQPCRKFTFSAPRVFLLESPLCTMHYQKAQIFHVPWCLPGSLHFLLKKKSENKVDVNMSLVAALITLSC